MAPRDVIGKDDYQMPWVDQAEAYRADDRAVMASGLPRLASEEERKTPDGGVIWLRMSKLPLRNKDDEIVGVLGIYEDITAQTISDIAAGRTRAEPSPV